MAIKVKLRQKKIKNNKISLYLDFYPAIPHPETGKPTRREFLGLYILDKPKTPIDKQHNKEKLQLAEQIRLKRENQLNKPEIYSEYEQEQLRKKQLGEKSFVLYFEKQASKRKGNNRSNWLTAINHFKIFAKRDIKFSEISERLCNEFKEYLLSKEISQNTASCYFSKFAAAIRQAYKDACLPIDFSIKIKAIPHLEVQRNFLTIDELNKLAQTPFKDDVLKRAALFSALTGLRFSDIKNLVYGEIHYSVENGYFIQFTQQKTKGVEVLPISEQAYRLLGERKENTDKVFEGLTYSTRKNTHLKRWIKNAGITKNITFHCFRHTFATLQLSKGTDIYTVSKMLGHRELKTTQIYAKIIDQAKREAADKIKLDM